VAAGTELLLGKAQAEGHVSVEDVQGITLTTVCG
jgi:hypothetical protein